MISLGGVDGLGDGLTILAQEPPNRESVINPRAAVVWNGRNHGMMGQKWAFSAYGAARTPFIRSGPYTIPES